jgi:hypothetical protein
MVDSITNINPITIVFLVPNQFFIAELNGEKMTCAAEKDAMIQDMSFADNAVDTPVLEYSQSFYSA